MAVLLEIDGVGRVEVNDSFDKLSPQEQELAVQQIRSQARAGGPSAEDQEIDAALRDRGVSRAPAQPQPQQPQQPFGLADTWPAQLAKGIYKSVKSAVTLPGDVLTGKVDPNSPEGAYRTQELGFLGTPIPASTRVGVGWWGAPKTGKTFDALMRESAPTQRAQDIASATRIGVDLPRAAASDSVVTQRVGQALSNVPIGGTSLRKASEAATTQLGEAAERAAVTPTGGRVGVEQAGATVREGIENYVGPVTTARSDKLYGAVDREVNPATLTSLNHTRRASEEIIGRRINAGRTPESAAIKEIENAVASPSGLNYFGIKDLRTAIGEQLKSGPLPAGTSQAELKQIYGALSEDLHRAVINAGGSRANALFERANTYHRLMSERRENVAQLLNAKSDESLFSRIVQMAGSGSSADAKLLAQVRKSLPGDEWAEVSSAAISRLGRDTAGNFSPALWVGKQGYGGLSDSGKAILFNSIPEGTALRRYLDDIAAVSTRAKAWARFGNPSGTAQNAIGVAQFTGAGAAGYAAIGGSVAEPLTAIGSVVGVSVLSRILASPVTAASTAQWSRAYERLVLRPAPATMAQFSIASRNLANTVSDKLGVSINPSDFLRTIQGPVRAPAEDEQR